MTRGAALTLDLLAVDVEMNTVSGYAMSPWETGYGDLWCPTCRRCAPSPGCREPHSCSVTCAGPTGARSSPHRGRSCADEHAIFRNGAKEIAAQEGMAISFMAKYDEREGSSYHIHFSLAGAQDGRPVFERGDTAFESFLAGQLHGLRELTLLLAPNVNSYKRFAAGSFAPTTVAWAEDNRTCALRVVGHESGLRFENRAGGADLNPYMALSALIAAGLAGIDQGLELEPALVGNACAATDRPQLPRTLREARDLFDGSELARTAFGEEVVDHSVHAADVELQAFESSVTDWERVRGFERL